MAAMLSWPQCVKKNIVPPTTDTPVIEHFTPSGTSLKVPNHNIPGVLWRWDDLLTVLCPKWKSETYQIFNIELDELTARRQQKSPRSLSGRSLHLTLVTKWSRSHMTLKIQISRSWPRSNPLSNLRPRVQIAMFTFRLVTIGPLLVDI